MAVPIEQLKFQVSHCTGQDSPLLACSSGAVFGGVVMGFVSRQFKQQSAPAGSGGDKPSAWPQPFPATFTGNNRCTSGCTTFLSVPIAKKCSSTPSHGPKRFTS
jgi:hypothetical protein